jgi:hypothetical protein
MARHINVGENLRTGWWPEWVTFWRARFFAAWRRISASTSSSSSSAKAARGRAGGGGARDDEDAAGFVRSCSPYLCIAASTAAGLLDRRRAADSIGGEPEQTLGSVSASRSDLGLEGEHQSPEAKGRRHGAGDYVFLHG